MNYPHFSVKRPHRGLIGHRGVAALAPENTMASFRLAAQLGIDHVEFDVRLTKDNGLVIFHDDLLDRTTNGKGLIDNSSLDVLTMLDAGSWFDPQFKDQKIPVFSEVLPELIDLKLFLNIELKMVDNPSPIQASRLAQKLCEVLSVFWPKNLPLPLISSFHWPILSLIRDQLPKAPLGFLVDQIALEHVLHVANVANSALHCEYQSLSPELILLAREYKVPLLAYTVNDPYIARDLLRRGMFALFSDNPRLIYDSVDI